MFLSFFYFIVCTDLFHPMHVLINAIADPDSISRSVYYLAKKKKTLPQESMDRMQVTCDNENKKERKKKTGHRCFLGAMIVLEEVERRR
jgi:hypothetical protein